MFESNDYNRNNLTQSKRFRVIFNTMSALDLLFTVVVPWLSILEHLIYRTAIRGHLHLHASHLFISQTQIALECIIIMAGENRKWIIFPFTLLANCYRLISILTWIARALHDTNLESRDVFLPAMAFSIWIYSTFVFIPRVWYPLIKMKFGKHS
jgi:hypothetical protein